MEPTMRPAPLAQSDTNLMNTTCAHDRHSPSVPATIPTDSNYNSQPCNKPAAPKQDSHVEVFPNSSNTSLSNLLTYGSECGSDVENLEIDDIFEESEDSVSCSSELPTDIPPIPNDNKEELSADEEDEEDDDDDEEEDSDDEAEVVNVQPDENKLQARRKSKKEKLDETLRKMGELQIDDLPPVTQSNAAVTSDDCDLIGTISNTLGKLVMVESIPNKPAYDIDTLLFLDCGKRPLGYIFDVIGPVHNPLYAIRFNSPDEISAMNLTIGQNVYSAPATEHTRYVFVQQLLQERGSDASWKNDVEVPQDMQDSSDDEASCGQPTSRKRHSLERYQQFEEDMNLRNALDTQMHQVRGTRRRPRYRQNHHHHQSPSMRGRNPPQNNVDVGTTRGGPRGGRRPPTRSFTHQPPAFYGPPQTATAASQCAYVPPAYNMAPCYGVAPGQPLPPYMPPMYMQPVFTTPPPPPGTLVYPPDMGLPPPVQPAQPFVPSMQFYNTPIVWTNYSGQPSPQQPNTRHLPPTPQHPPPSTVTSEEQRDKKSGDNNYFML